MSSVDDTINNFITVAERFYGVKEGSPQHSIILALYNSSKPANEYQMGPTDPWCAAFVGAVSGGCGLEKIIPVSAHCERLENGLRASGAVKTKDPKRGDIALFDWTGDGKYDDHVGIVVSVNETTVQTIEGNKNDSVAYRYFAVNSLPVIFYRPNWSGDQAIPTEQISWSKYREYYYELAWFEKSEIKTFPLIKAGSSGIYVKILQDFLGVTVDGNFGIETEGALKQYQEKKQLEADGVCGRQTWSSFFV